MKATGKQIAIIFYMFLAVWMIVVLYMALDIKADAIDVRVSKAERTLITLHTCFPNGHYQSDAAPTCPAFKETVVDKLNKTEVEQ